MRKTYRTPIVDVRKYKLPYNSVFTDSGDKIDDDIYGPTNPAGGKLNEDIFGD